MRKKENPNKLFPSKWKLFWKRLKWHLFVKRPIPLLDRGTCPKCNVTWNKALNRSCPLCGRGPNKVWIVLEKHSGRICGVYRDPDDAEFERRALQLEYSTPIIMEGWEVKTNGL